MLSITRHLALSLPLLAALTACGTTVVNNDPSSSSSSSSSGAGASGGAGGTGGDVSTTSTGTGGVDPGMHIVPPSAGAPVAPDGAGTTTFAISKLYLGDTNRDGTPNPSNAWKQFGFDLDGKISTASSADLCKPRKNAPPQNVYPDGAGGIDNSFGKNLLPIFLGIAGDFTTKTNESIVIGRGTELFDLTALGSGSDYNPMLGRYYFGANLGAPPAFDGSDAWPINPASLVNPGNPASAKVQFPQSYLVGNTWVAYAPGDELTVRLFVSNFTLDLVIGSPIVAMQLDAAHQHANNGTIAGVLSTAQITQAMKTIAGTFDPSLCSGPTIDSILTQIEQASDIMADGTQDPNKDCDGISIGIGFDATQVTLGPIAPPDSPSPDPCP